VKALSQEQQKQITTTVVIAVAGCVVLWILYQYVLFGLYLDKRDALAKQVTESQKLADKNSHLLDEAKRDTRAWTTLNILDVQKEKDAIDRTSALVYSTIKDLAQRAGMTIEDWQDLGAHPSNGHPDFQEVKFSARMRTTTNRIAGFLLALEQNATFPARLDQIKYHTKTPGQDDLDIDLTIATLVYSPRAVAATKPAVGAQATTRTSASTTMASRGGAAGTGTPEAAVDPKTQELLLKREAELIERRKQDEIAAAKLQAETEAFSKLSDEDKQKWLENKRKTDEIAATQKAAEDEVRRKQIEAEMEKKRQLEVGAVGAPGGAK